MRKRPVSPVGLIIKNRLNQIGMTQYELAQRVGTTTNYIYLITSGERSGKGYLAKISKELDIDLELELATETA